MHLMCHFLCKKKNPNNYNCLQNWLLKLTFMIFLIEHVTFGTQGWTQVTKWSRLALSTSLMNKIMSASSPLQSFQMAWSNKFFLGIRGCSIFPSLTRSRDLVMSISRSHECYEIDFRDSCGFVLHMSLVV